MLYTDLVYAMSRLQPFAYRPQPRPLPLPSVLSITTGTATTVTKTAQATPAVPTMSPRAAPTLKRRSPSFTKRVPAKQPRTAGVPLTIHVRRSRSAGRVSPASSTSSSSTSTSTPSSPLEPHTTTVSSRAGRDTISSLNSAFDGAPGASWVDLGPPYLFLDDDDHESDDENTMAVDTWPRLPPHDASASGSETTNYKLND